MQKQVLKFKKKSEERNDVWPSPKLQRHKVWLEVKNRNHQPINTLVKSISKSNKLGRTQVLLLLI